MADLSTYAAGAMNRSRIALGALLAFVALTVLVQVGATASLDRAANDAARAVAGPVGDYVASAITLLGRIDIAFAIAAIAIVVLLVRRQALAIVPAYLPFAYVVGEYLKTVIGRMRPPAGLGQDLHLLPQILPKASETLSYPSGHALLAAFLAVAIGAAAPGWRPLLWALAIGVALSRVYLAKHWLTDVAAGALLGVAIAELAILLVTWAAARWRAARAARLYAP